MSRTTTIRKLGVAVAALGATAALAGPAMALSPALPQATIANGPAYVTVTLPVQGGPLNTTEGDIEARDADPADGRASVSVTASGITVSAQDRQAFGVMVHTSVASGPSSRIDLTATRGTFAFLSYDVVEGGSKLRVRLWKSDPTFPGATLRDDGCLRITRFAGTTGRVSAAGLELTPLFEHGLVLQLRNAAGRSVGLRPLIAREGTFKPDFSGYAKPGTWSGTVTHRVARRQRGVLQAWVTSARDGALDCMVQVPVTLAPRAAAN